MSIITQTNPTSIWLVNLIYINPASTYAMTFSSIPLPLKMCFFIYPASALTIIWCHQCSLYLHESILLQLTQRFFLKSSFHLRYSHQSSFCFHMDLFNQSSFNLQHEIVSSIPLPLDTIFMKFSSGTFYH